MTGLAVLSAMSESQRGAVAEWATDTLTLLLTGGELRLARPLPDDTLADRFAVRPGSSRGSFLQVKTRVSTARGRYLQFRVTATGGHVARERLWLLGTHLVDRSPWLGDVVALVPISKLGRPAPSGFWSLTLPLDPAVRSKWRPYIHPVSGLGTAVSRALDGGPAYAFPPKGGALSLVRRMSHLARGFIIENEAAVALTVYSGGGLHVWPAAVDTFGQDFMVTRESRAEALRVQPKGAFTVRADGTMTVRVHKSNFRALPFNILMFLLYRPELPGLHRYGYIMRADEFEKRAVDTGRDLVFVGRPEPVSRDKVRDWLYDVREMPAVLDTALETVAREGAQALVPTRRAAVVEARRRMGLKGLRGGLAGAGRRAAR